MKRISLALCLLLLFSLCSCSGSGVSQEEYDALQNELNELKQQISELPGQADTSPGETEQSDFLEESASLAQDAPEETQELDIGTRKNPAKIGDEVLVSISGSDGTGTISVSLTQVIRGSEAASMVADANMFNSPAGSGKEYILGNFTVTFVEDKSGADVPCWLNSADFDYSTSDYSIQSTPVVVAPEPKFDLTLYEGAAGSGWVVFLADEGEESPKAILNDSTWFDLQ